MGVKTNVTAKLAISIVMVILAAKPVLAEKVIYVGANVTGADDGTSWENAYNHLQDALADANSSEKPVEIRVAQGVYTPDSKSAVPNGTGDREATFRLINGVSLMGGYAGRVAGDPNARDVEKYKTILSGDLDGNDVELGEAWLWWHQGQEPSRIDNSYHVVTGSYTDSSANLAGFTITSGVTWGCELEGGGGMCNLEGSPTVSECTFAENTARHGAGMYNYNGAPEVSGCTYYRNWATISTDGRGGGVKNSCGPCSAEDVPRFRSCAFIENYTVGAGGGMDNGTNSVLVNCLFIRNTSQDLGGGMSNSYCSAVITQCSFVDNVALFWGGGGGMDNFFSSPVVTYGVFVNNISGDRGGGMHNRGGSPIVTNCLFAGNSSSSSAGGMYNGDSSATMTNCTFTGNHSCNGGGMLNSGEATGRSAILRNCILWGNTGLSGRQMKNMNACEPSISFSTIEDGLYGSGIENTGGSSVIDGGGNIDADPCFADPGYWAHKDDPNLVVEPNDPNKLWVNGDYHLKSQAGRWDPSAGDWVLDDVVSLCIDAGDPMTPIGVEAFPNGGIVNIGAYGGTSEASKSYFDGPVCEIIVAGDINGDCAVNFLDFRIMALHWLDEH